MYTKEDAMALEQKLEHIQLPEMFCIEQLFEKDQIDHVKNLVTDRFKDKLFRSAIASQIKNKKYIAVCVGSRGIAHIDDIVEATVLFLKEMGLSPFIVPAMGSHGGATAEGQLQTLASYGITSERMNVAVKKESMTTEVIAYIDDIPLHWDKLAANADAVVLINRIKPHTSFRYKIESGLYKMATVGLGNHKGAETCHAAGFEHIGERIEKLGNHLFASERILFGVAIIENALDQTKDIHLLPSKDIPLVEPLLLEVARRNMPQILPSSADVLIVDEIGKNFSGPGADPNVTGCFATNLQPEGFAAKQLVVLNISSSSHGNANGIGVASVSTLRALKKIKFKDTYMNGLISTLALNAKLPMILPSDQAAIRAAIKFSHVNDPEKVKIVRIKNTLELQNIQISTAYLKETENHEQIKVISAPKPFDFNEQGDLF